MTKTLEREVMEIIKDQGTEEEQKEFMLDVLSYGCQSGMVSELIYYHQTEDWFKKHRPEIMTMLNNFVDDVGMEAPQLFGDKWISLEDIEMSFETDFDYDDFENDEEFDEAVDNAYIEFMENVDVELENSNLLAWFSFEEMTRIIYEDSYGLF